jgi:maleylacetate reductase
MLQSGRVAFGAMEAVVFGRPAAAAIAEETRRLGAERVFLMASGTLNRTTDEIAKVRQALGNRFAGIFDRMRPHTPRHAVIEAAAAARDAEADLIATIGGGSVTDGAKAVQLCLANDIRTAEALDGYRPVKGPDGALAPPPCNPPIVRQITVPTTLSASEFSANSAPSRGSRTSAAGSRNCFAIRRSCRASSCSTRRSRCTPPNGSGSQPASGRSITASRASARLRPTPTRMRRPCTVSLC